VFTGGATTITNPLLPSDVLDLIAAADDNSWVKLNTNTFQSVWPSEDYEPLKDSGPSGPFSILECWASMGWDDVNFRAIFWGGGHANSNGNDLYLFNAASRQWQLGFYSSDVTQGVVGGMGAEPVDWPETPQSSHTYDSQQWLPILQRFITFGGAAQSSGGAFQIRGTPDRAVGCFLADLTSAGTGKVGGTTGSNVKRNTTVGVSLSGANAWTYRDWFLDHADPHGALSSYAQRQNSVSAYRQENGHDTIYYKCGPAHLMRFEFVDSDYHNDIITKVGNAFTTMESPMGGALDSTKNLFVSLCHPGSAPNYRLTLWDLNIAGPSNNDIGVLDSGLGGPDAAEFLAQMDDSPTFSLEYDEKRRYFIAWQRGGRVYSIEPPASSPWDTGWIVTKLSDDTLPLRPLTVTELAATTEADQGVNGKWRRSANLDVYIGVQKRISGDVWAFKPANWVDPR
jgi:hypothetical protein